MQLNVAVMLAALAAGADDRVVEMRPVVRAKKEAVLSAPIRAKRSVSTGRIVQTAYKQADGVPPAAVQTAPVVESMAPAVMQDGAGCSSGNCGAVYSAPESNMFAVSSSNASRMYVRGEWLNWWVDGDNSLPLVSTSPNGTPVGQAGVLGTPDATVLQQGDYNDDGMSGFRFSGGILLSKCQGLWLDGSFFYFPDNGSQATYSSDGDPILARPFFNTQTGLNDAQIIAFPGIVQGAITIDNGIDRFQGADVNLRRNLMCNSNCNGGSKLDGLIGYRYFAFDEHLYANEVLVSTAINSNVLPGTLFDLVDRIDTRNTFHGGQLGLVHTVNRGQWFVESTGKLGLGQVSQRITTFGQTTITVPQVADPTILDGAFLVLPGESGTRRQSEFAWLVDGSVYVGRQVNCNLSVAVGYNLFYINNIVRPGHAVRTDIDPNRLPPAIVDAPARNFFDSTGLFAHGFGVRAELKY